ncbi:MAG: AtpZ/AtpI family protein [Chloroflexi bacterium]|nr:AtpZ/AtpI family protein [Chloroflexota bacterium]
MNQPSAKPDANRPAAPNPMRFAGLGAQVGCLTLLIVLASVFGGIWLDRILDTKPTFTVILVLGSAPLSLVLTFWLAMRTIKDINQQPPSGGKIIPRKEDDDSE